MKSYLSLKKLGLLLLASFFIVIFVTTFQNCQQAQFSSKVLKSSIPLELSLTSSPVNSVNCNDGLKVTIEKRGDFFAEAPYSFDGGKTWGISNFFIYTQATVIDIGEIMVMDSNNNTVSNTRAYTVDMISCNLNVGLSCIAPPGSYCPDGSGTHQTCSAGYTCAGGLALPQVCTATAGYYCPVGSTEPVICPVDKTCAGGMNQPVSANSGSTPIIGVCKNSTPLGCTSGTAIGDNGQFSCNTNRTWYCSGQNGGANSVLCSYSNVSCNAQSTAGLCNNGTPAGCLIGSAISDNNQTTCGTARTWYCSGQNGGSNSSQCSFANASCAQPIAGTCNNSVAGGCIAGSTIQDNNQTACGTTRTWSCSGQNGGANSSPCSLANTTCVQPINGSCSNTTPAGCITGLAISDNNQTACGTTRTWSCSGQNGGSTSAPCSYSNQACVAATYSFTINNLSFDPGLNGYQVLSTFDTDVAPGKVNPISIAITNTGNTACTPKAEQILNFLNGAEDYLSTLSIVQGTFFSNMAIGGQANINFNDTMTLKKPATVSTLVNTNQVLHTIKLKCAEDTSNSSDKVVQILPKINIISNVVTCGLNTCGTLSSVATNYFLPADLTGKRVTAGENLNIFPSAINQKFYIHKGAQVSIYSSYSGLTYYFERPVNEYTFSSSGNNFRVADSCGRVNKFPLNPTNPITLIFPEGAIKATIQDSPIMFKITSGGATFFVDGLAENVSQIDGTLKVNLTSGENSQPYFTCPLNPIN